MSIMPEEAFLLSELHRDGMKNNLLLYNALMVVKSIETGLITHFNGEEYQCWIYGKSSKEIEYIKNYFKDNWDVKIIGAENFAARIVLTPKKKEFSDLNDIPSDKRNKLQ